ncbi:MAG: serine hydrolase domain-containing protein [Sulfurifustaceae bacterium]
MLRKTLLAVTALSLTACASLAEKPNEAGLNQGFSLERLDAIGSQIRAEVASRQLPGAVLLIARNGKVIYQDVIGMQDPQARTPMRADSIFRIASMTKPVVSVAVMQLVEDGKIKLTDPVSRYLPELAGLKVGVEKTDARGKTALEIVPAAREPTIHDLLRHTSGITYGVFGRSLVKDEYKKVGVDSPNQTNSDTMQKLATVPLMFQPGTVWEYSRSTDVLGALLESYSGESLDQYLDRRIFKPLKMNDTGFWVADPAKHARIAQPFDTDPETNAGVNMPDVRRAPKLLSGGGGLVSTASDYARFAQMLLNGGELDGVRILSRKTVEFMTSDHLGDMRGPSLARGAAFLPGPGYSFGLGFGVRVKEGEAVTPGSVGDYGWGGIYGTYFWVDPKENLVVVWMSQQIGHRVHYRQLLRDMVYGALVQ